MNKIFSTALLLASALAFTGCAGEEEDLFDKSAAERLNETQKLFSGRLTDSEDGWAMEYYPTSSNDAPTGLGYLMLVDFNKNSEVKVAMQNAVSGNAYKESTSVWEVITDNGPVLSFDTYNDCLHAFSDPAGNASFGTETGKGFEGDYEFVMVDVPEGGDYIMLKGKKRGTYIRLTRLDKGTTDFKAYLADVIAFKNKLFSASAPNNCLMNLGGDSVMVIRNASSGMAGVYPQGKDPIVYETSHPFLITKRGGKYYMRFRDAFTASDGKDVQEFVYDEKADKFNDVSNSGYSIEGENPDSFFVSTISNSGYKLRATSEMSADLKQKIQKVSSEFSSKRMRLNRFDLINSGTVLRLNYFTSSTASSSADFAFDFAKTSDGFTLKYIKPLNQSATNVFNGIPSLEALFAALSDTYKVEASTTGFDLSNLKLVSSANAEKWMILSFN